MATLAVDEDTFILPGLPSFASKKVGMAFDGAQDSGLRLGAAGVGEAPRRTLSHRISTDGRQTSAHRRGALSSAASGDIERPECYPLQGAVGPRTTGERHMIACPTEAFI
jgi:hypothetical protein